MSDYPDAGFVPPAALVPGDRIGGGTVRFTRETAKRVYITLADGSTFHQPKDTPIVLLAPAGSERR